MTFVGEDVVDKGVIRDEAGARARGAAIHIK